ncbi:unnamed protein product, partial [Rotaria sordida]
QLARLHRTTRESPHHAKTLILYRGQRMLIDEFEKLKNNEGGLLSISNFLSSSTNREVARVYADKSDHEIMAMVFQIILNLNDETSYSFVCIEEFSHIGADEREWLFSMRTIFRIGKNRIT